MSEVGHPKGDGFYSALALVFSCVGIGSFLYFSEPAYYGVMTDLIAVITLVFALLSTGRVWDEVAGGRVSFEFEFPRDFGSRFCTSLGLFALWCWVYRSFAGAGLWLNALSTPLLILGSFGTLQCLVTVLLCACRRRTQNENDVR